MHIHVCIKAVALQQQARGVEDQMMTSQQRQTKKRRAPLVQTIAAFGPARGFGTQDPGALENVSLVRRCCFETIHISIYVCYLSIYFFIYLFIYLSIDRSI